VSGSLWAKLAHAAHNPDFRDRAARASASLALPMLAGVLAGDPRAGMVAATGGFAGLLAGVVPYRRRAHLLASLTIAFPLAIALGTLAAPSAVVASLVPGAVAAVAAFAFRAFALPAPREYPLVLACLMATGLPVDPGAAPERALEAFGGAAAAFAIGMAGCWRHPRRPEHGALASCASAIADLLDALPEATDAQGRAAVMATREARTTLLAAGPGADPLRPQLSALEAACSAALFMAADGDAPATGQAARLRAAVSGEAPAPEVEPEPEVAGSESDPAAQRLERALQRLETAAPGEQDETSRAGSTSAARGAGGASIRARLSAAADRDALAITTAARLGIAVAAGAGLGHAIGLSRPYWAGLTAGAVLQGATGPLQRRRATDRAIGTVIGVVVAQPLVELHPLIGLDIVVVALCMFVAQLTIRASYAVAVVFLTQLPLFMMDLAGADPGRAITGARLVDTLIGCALGVAITQVLWPRAATARLPAAAQRVLDATVACLRTLRDPTASRAAVAEARAQALAEVVRLESMVDMALGEGLGASPESEDMASVAGEAERLGRLVVGIPYGGLRGGFRPLGEHPQPKASAPRESFGESFSEIDEQLDRLRAAIERRRTPRHTERRSAMFFARSLLRPISKSAMSTLHRDADARLRAPPWYEHEPVRFLTETVRGVGQVDLQDKLITGAVITIALFSAGWKPGVFGLLGAAVSTATAVALGVDRSRIVNGLEGYCGALIGIAAVTFLGLHLSSWLVAISGAMACTVITAAMGTMLGSWKLSPLTGPFCVVGTAIAIGGPGFERIWHGGASAALPSATTGSTSLSLGNFVESLCTNVSEIFLLDKWWAGLIMLAGLGLASRKVLLAAVAGSLIGTLTAWAVGAPADLITEGIYGYNAVLVMIALGATFLAPTAINMAFAVVAAIFSTLMTATLAEFFAPFGGHTLTWPFNLTTWAFLAAVPVFNAITTPKEQASHEPRAS
jgi:urea transporter